MTTRTPLFLSLSFVLLSAALNACTNAYNRLSDTYRSPDEALLVDRIEASQRCNESMLGAFENLTRTASGPTDRTRLEDAYQEAARQGWEARRLMAAAVDVANRIKSPPPAQRRTWLESINRADAAIASVLEAVERTISPALIEGGSVGVLTTLSEQMAALRVEVAATDEAAAALTAALRGGPDAGDG